MNYVNYLLSSLKHSHGVDNRPYLRPTDEATEAWGREVTHPKSHSK